MYACLMAAERVPDFSPMTIITDSMYVYKGLTTSLKRWEDRGWTGVANGDVIKRVVARLRRRSAKTYLTWVKGHSGILGNVEADALAGRGALDVRVQMPLMPEEEMRFLAPGARLVATSQKLAYENILTWCKPATRTRSERAISMIKSALNEEVGVWPTAESIWNNIWSKDMSIRVSVFFWKAVHGAHRVGEYWSKIPGYEGRAVCPTCNEVESMEHILAECQAPGQKALWDMTKRMLEKKGIVLNRLSIGAILGIPSWESRTDKGETCPGKTRLLRISLSETAYLVWKIRCERVISWQEQPDRTHSDHQLRSLWARVMGERLRLDLDRTRRKWGKRSLPRNVVLETWRGTLHDEKALPEDWTETTGVLVGTLHDSVSSGIG
ncbi:hypothetical protein C2E23DRAFT_866206 [Lenzites betulinus]|nr:hypothetical protein C2E23DRAFT_866206 [Lenzites betulinus]